jgi:acetyl-CoA acetyltransferase
MQRYMYEYDVPLDAFAGFSINAHRNGANNPNAMFQEAITLNEYVRAPVIATPINIMDSSPVCDGAAALILAPTEMGASLHDRPPSRRGAHSGQRQRQRHAGRTRPQGPALPGGSADQQSEGAASGGRSIGRSRPL